MKAVQLLINSILPEDLRDYNRTYDKKSIAELSTLIAERYPDRYEELVQKIATIGRKAAYNQGETLTLDDMYPTFDKDALLAQMDEEVSMANIDAEDEEDFRMRRLKIWSKYADLLEKETVRTALASGNRLGDSIISGARGKPGQLRGMITTPALFTDYKDEPIPLFVRHSFGQGLRPAEYLASSFGTRKGVLSTKNATAFGGDLGKLMNQTAANLIVTSTDCGTTNGIDLDPDDDSLRGRVLARSYKGYKADTIVDKKLSSKLAREKGKILVRSPLTCEAEDGVCAKCTGTLAAGGQGKLPSVGDAVGLTASTSLGEPITQGALNCLVEGTEVRMSDFTTKKIEDIKPGDTVLGADIKGNTFPTKVTHVWDQGKQPTQRYTYKMGQTKQLLHLDCTEEHPILCNTKTYGKTNGKLNHSIQKLKAGTLHNNLFAVLPTKHDTEYLCHEKLGLLYGCMLGDGIRLNDVSGEVRISCADPILIKDLNEYLKPFNTRLAKRKRSHDYAISLINDNLEGFRDFDGKIKQGVRNPVKKMIIEDWDMLGKYAHDKSIVKEVFQWGQEQIELLLAGYIATDGSVFKNKDGHIGISFSSCSKPLVEDLKALLALRLCVYSSSVTRTGKEGTGNRKHDQWQFTITRKDQVKKLMGVLKTLPGVKGQRIKDLIKSADSYEDRNPDYFYTCKRIYIEDTGVKQCWDITVAHKDSLFVLSNGLIVSNTKHGGGAYSGKREFSGLDVISQVLQSPKVFPDKAEISQVEGSVSEIKDAPQGGKIVVVDGVEHYVQSGYGILVKPGQVLNKGDQISEGVIDPGEVVDLLGLGAGRRAYSENLKKVMENSKMGYVDKKNTELLARNAINHIRIDNPEGLGGYLPDDIASYNKFVRSYSPPEDTKLKTLENAGKGEQYLQAPALHYTIGTKITPQIISKLKDAGITQVATSTYSPEFTPEMFRLRTASHQTNKDWLAKLQTSYLTDNLKNDVMVAADTNVEENVHFAPRLAIGEGFGKNIRESGKF